MTITLGTWIIPAVITVLAFALAVFKTPKERGPYRFGDAFIGLLFSAAAAIVSLIAWLIWALFA